jgi:hypothetical protein
MENSTIYKKLLNIQGLQIMKDEENPYYHTRYASLTAIVATLTPLLKEANLVVTHRTDGHYLITEIIDIDSGEKISTAINLPDIADPQKIGSFITYAKRYNLSELFNLITDDDDDANIVSQPIIKEVKKENIQKKLDEDEKQANKVLGGTWQKPVVITKEQEKTLSSVCPKCGKIMWESKFKDKETGLKYYYCSGYKNATAKCYYKVLVRDDEVTLDDLDNALKSQPPFQS